MSIPRITVLGSVNMDLVVTAAELPKPGETVLGTTFDTIPGGKGANQAIAAARAGGTVSMIAAVGTDAFGQTLQSNLQANSVDIGLTRQVLGSSGIAMITVNSQAENSIVVVPGANGQLGSLTPTDIAHIAASSALVCQLEIPMATVIAGVTAAAAAGVTVLLNPSPVCELPADLLSGVTILVVNEGEEQALGRQIDQVPHVVTTLGAAGARYRNRQGHSLRVRAPQVNAIDTTGAGDAFAGALAVMWAEGKDAEAALQFACCAGALATTVRGASTSAASRLAIEALVANTYQDPAARP